MEIERVHDLGNLEIVVVREHHLLEQRLVVAAPKRGRGTRARERRDGRGRRGAEGRMPCQEGSVYQILSSVLEIEYVLIGFFLIGSRV